LAPIEC